MKVIVLYTFYNKIIMQRRWFKVPSVMISALTQIFLSSPWCLEKYTTVYGYSALRSAAQSRSVFFIECHSKFVSTLVSYLGGTGFRSLPIGRLSWVRTLWFSRKKFQDCSSSEAMTVSLYILTHLLFSYYWIICHYVISATESVIIYTITKLMKKNISCLLLVHTCK
jgi:hypothetical protein